MILKEALALLAFIRGKLRVKYLLKIIKCNLYPVNHGKVGPGTLNIVVDSGGLESQMLRSSVLGLCKISVMHLHFVVLIF